jgi:hypothetical protein
MNIECLMLIRKYTIRVATQHCVFTRLDVLQNECFIASSVEILNSNIYCMRNLVELLILEGFWPGITYRQTRLSENSVMANP